MSDIPIYPIEDAEGNPVAVQVYENGVFHNNGNPVGCVTEEDAIAQKFDTTASFAKGTYCMQNHKMQKFKAAKSAGDWDASKADQTTVGNELTQLNSTLDDLVITRNYSFTYNIGANADLNISANDLQIIRPSGYIPLSLYEITSGYTNVLIRNIILSSTGTDTVVTLRNISNSAVSGATMYLTMKYIKSSVQG